MDRCRGRCAIGLIAGALIIPGCGDGQSSPLPTAPPLASATIDGTYTLQFDSTCAALPAELRSRTYTASIGGSPDILVTLTGAVFWTHPTDGLLNRMTGRVTGNSVSLSLFWPPGIARWGIVEQVDSTGYLEIIGVGSGSFTGSTIEGTLSAGIGFGSDLLDDARHVGCPVNGHTLTFRFTRNP